MSGQFLRNQLRFKVLTLNQPSLSKPLVSFQQQHPKFPSAQNDPIFYGASLSSNTDNKVVLKKKTFDKALFLMFLCLILLDKFR